MIKTVTICAALITATAANAQNSIYDTVGLGFGGSATISPGGTGPTADTATDPYGAKVNITVGGSASNLPLYDLVVGVDMYYLPIIGANGGSGKWECVPGLHQGPEHGPAGEIDYWPRDTTVQINQPPELPGNIYFLWFQTGGNFFQGGGFPIGHVLQAQLVCAKHTGQP